METKPTTQVFLYNENPVSFQTENGSAMINATTMAKPFGNSKRAKNWLALSSTNELLEVFSKGRNLPLADLVIVRRGGDTSGTWMQKDVALAFAQWLNPQFHAWCIDRIQELLNFGITASDDMLDKIKSDPEYAHEILAQVEESRKLSLELQAQIAANAHKVLFFDNVKHIDEKDKNRRTFTVTQIAKSMGITPYALNRMLIFKGIVTKLNGNIYISDKYKDCGYALERFSPSKGFDDDDKEIVKDAAYLVWTYAGRDFLITFLSEFIEKKGPKPKKSIKYLDAGEY